jgi:hypothetical protein
VREYRLDGRRTTSLDAFHAELGRVVLGRADWGASAEGVDLLLRDAAGAPAARVRVVWRHAAAARAALGYAETVRQRTAELRDCAPNVLIRTAWALRAALRGTGPTLFDALVRQLESHPNVVLALEGDDAAPAPAAADA